VGDRDGVGDEVMVDLTVVRVGELVVAPDVLDEDVDCCPAGEVHVYDGVPCGVAGRRECFTAGAGFGAPPGTMTDAASVRIVLDGAPLSLVPSSLMPRPTRAARSKDVPMATRADAESTPPPRARTRQPPFSRLSRFVGRTDPRSVPPNG
jgi:hypothetical protein